MKKLLLSLALIPALLSAQTTLVVDPNNLPTWPVGSNNIPISVDANGRMIANGTGGGGGSGTVTSVSVVTANGVSGSVATATTTPAITLTLGDITPTSVAASGTVASGVGATTAGAFVLKQGTTQSTGTTNITIQAPTGVTSFLRTLPAAVGSTGFLLETVSGTTQTETLVSAIPSAFTATTQSAADNSTKIATTAYADAAVAAGVTASSTTTLTNKRVTARITTITSSATPTVNTDNCDCVTITAQAAAITSMTTNLSGTPVNFDQLEYRILDNGTARAITWGASFVAGPTALPTTTVLSKALHVFFEWDSVRAAWVCISSGSDA